MKSFKEFLEDEQNEPTYLLIEVPEEMLGTLNIALESYWQPYDSKWSYRVDAADPKIPQQRHIHIAQKKHTSSKNQQASWNVDGSRHDKNSFNTNTGKTKKAQEIARSVLKLGHSIALEHFTVSDSDERILLECVFDNDHIKILIIK